MGRQRVAERDRQRKKRKLKRERKCQSSNGMPNVDNEAGTSSVSEGAAAAAADAGRSGKRRRRRLRQQAAAAADRGAQASVSTDGAAVAPEDTESTKADGGQNDGKSDIDTSITKVEVHVAMATESAASEKDDGAMRIERMRLKKQQRKAAREAKRRKAQATAS